MTRIQRVFKFGFVGITISAVGTLLAGCSAEDQLRALLIAFLMLLTGGGGEEAEQAQPIKISVGNNLSAELNPGFIIFNDPDELTIIFEKPANETGELDRATFYLDTGSTLPGDLQVFTVTHIGGNDFTIRDVSSTITVTATDCPIESICTLALAPPLQIAQGDYIGWFFPSGGAGTIAVDIDPDVTTEQGRTCTGCIVTPGSTIATTSATIGRIVFGGTGSTP